MGLLELDPAKQSSAPYPKMLFELALSRSNFCGILRVVAFVRKTLF